VGCSNVQEESPLDIEKAKVGFQVYESKCQSCHSDEKLAPSLSIIDSIYRYYFPGPNRYSEKLIRFLDYSEKAEFIEGAKVKWGEMPVVELSAEEKENVVYFISKFRFSDKEWMKEKGDSLIQKWTPPL
jgi:mono/diheme cytochrome c family protein